MLLFLTKLVELLLTILLVCFRCILEVDVEYAENQRTKKEKEGQKGKA